MKNPLIILYNQMEQQVNEKAAQATRILLYLEATVYLLDHFQIFNVSPGVMDALLLSTIIPLLLPTILINFLHLNKIWVKYAIVTCIAIATGMFYIVLTFQTVLLFVLPSILAMLYLQRKLLIVSVIETICCILLSHFTTSFILLQPHIEPFVGLGPILLYGALPRTLQYLFVSLIIFIMQHCIENAMQVLAQTEDRNTDKEYEANSDLVDSVHSLTERELDVCKLLVQGHTNIQIAYQLHLSVGTVKNYVSAIYDKIGIRDRTMLALSLSGYFHDLNQESNE